MLHESINTTSEELIMLEDLKGKLSNKTFIEYVNLQINRLNSENRTYTYMLESSDIYQQYKNGQISASRALSLINDKNEQIRDYSNKTAQIKMDADSFLSSHNEIKERFNNMSIDEDFLYNEIQEVNVQNVK